MLNVGGTMGGRAGVPMSLNRLTATRVREAVNAGWWQPRQLLGTIISWMHRGYTQANAGDLAAAVAFNALVALIPTFLLAFSIAGVFLRSDEFLRSSVYASLWGLPSGAADDALDAVLAARRTSSWLGAISLVAFAWTGAGFVGCLSRSMNRVYGVPGCGYMCEKRRGFFVILAFAVLFMAALLASTVPTLFVRQDLPVYFQTWSLAAGWYQVLGYGVAFVTTALLFGMLYRVVPNAGQRVRDIWPGMLTATALFLIMAQVFPIYLRLLGGANRYGAAFGLLTLLVAWFFLLAHVLMFGTYVNATYQRHLRDKEIRRQARRASARPA